jgi:hypothetical protein
MAKRSKKNDSQDKVIEFVLDENRADLVCGKREVSSGEKSGSEEKGGEVDCQAADPT